VLALARDFGPAGPPGAYPERLALRRPQPGPVRTAARAALAVGAAAALAGAAGLTYSRLR
jgi:hypothetical protein